MSAETKRRTRGARAARALVAPTLLATLWWWPVGDAQRRVARSPHEGAADDVSAANAAPAPDRRDSAASHPAIRGAASGQRRRSRAANAPTTELPAWTGADSRLAAIVEDTDPDADADGYDEEPGDGGVGLGLARRAMNAAEAQFQREEGPGDADWEDELHDYTRAALEEVALDPDQLVDLRCADTVCRAELVFDDLEDARELYASAKREDLRVTVLPDLSDPASPRVVAYLRRTTREPGD